MSETQELYVSPDHRVPDDEWAAVVARAQEVYENELEQKTGGAASPAGKVVDYRGQSNKHSGVSGLPTQLLVLHSAECPLRSGFAISLTEWGINSGVVASWHRFIDPLNRVYMIDDSLAAWHASEANPMSIGWEQAGYARFTLAEWTTPDGLLQMESLAYDMAQVAKRDGIPPVWLTTAQVTAITSGRDRKTKGFCAHRQIDPESRTDPGNAYPYDLLMQKIRAYMGLSTVTPSSSTKEPFTMGQFEDLKDDIAEVKKIASNTHAGIWNGGVNKGKQFNYGILPIVVHNQTLIAQGQAQVTALIGAIAAMSKGEPFDEAKLLAGVEAAAERGSLKALENGTVTVDVNVNGGAQ